MPLLRSFDQLYSGRVIEQWLVLTTKGNSTQQPVIPSCVCSYNQDWQSASDGNVSPGSATTIPADITAAGAGYDFNLCCLWSIAPITWQWRSQQKQSTKSHKYLMTVHFTWVNRDTRPKYFMFGERKLKSKSFGEITEISHRMLSRFPSDKSQAHSHSSSDGWVRFHQLCIIRSTCLWCHLGLNKEVGRIAHTSCNT